MARPTKITLNLSALQHNFQQVKKLAPQAKVLAMVKSNAYGHGLERIALALREADAFGVACLKEGLLLRQAGIEQEIILMEGLFSLEEIAIASAHNMTLVIHHLYQIEMLEQCPAFKPFPIWLKIDTGMHRLGFAPEDLPAVYQRLMQCRSVIKPFGLMSHFAEADVTHSEATLQQIENFNQVTAEMCGPRSLANSAGIIAWPAAHADWVRPGIMLYGASPFAGRAGSQDGLQPVMELSTALIATHHLKAGDRVGYGGEWVCPEAMPIGVVGIGYGDGYPRHVRSGVPILVNGRPCPLIGRVAMDMVTVDLRSQPEAQVGDPVILWGTDLPVEVVASYSDTTAYELLTRITQRVTVEIKSDKLPEEAYLLVK